MAIHLPHVLATPLATLRRDLRAATAGLRGRALPPVMARDGRAWPTPAPPSIGREVRVDAVEALGVDAARIWLVDPTGAPPHFQAGQFLTVVVTVNGAIERRAYSICSDPASPDRVAIAVRRLPGGRVSPVLVDGLRVGDTLQVLGPSGIYGHGVDGGRRAHHVLLAGGAGVGPNLSIATALLAGEPRSHFTFVLADRHPSRLMLRQPLEALAAAHPDRFRLVLMVEDAPADWHGRVGRLDADGLTAALASGTSPDGAAPERTLWYLCGPAGMVSVLEPALAARGVRAADISTERFLPPPDGAALALPATAQRVTVQVGETRRTITVPPGRTILEAARLSGVALPSSCTMGGCGACKQHRVSGRVQHRTPNCLSAQEEARGIVLTCVAHPLSAVTLEPV